MEQNLQKTYNTNWLSKYMGFLGYKDISDGVCLGLSYMSMHAMLLDELEIFVNRLKAIKDIFYNKNIALSNNEKSDILAFLDGVMLYQTFQSPSVFCRMLNIRKSRYIYWSHVFDIVKPIMFDRKQVNIYNIYKNSGCYQTKELFLFITVLEKYLSKLKFNSALDLNFNSKIPIILLSNKHAIILGYNYISNTWNIVDLGGLQTQLNWLLYVKSLYNKQQIIDLIYMAFTGLHVVPSQVNINLSISIYVAGCSRVKVNIIKKQFYNAINQDYNWLLINSIIKNKLGVTVVGESWLYSACLSGHYAIVKKLIIRNADVNLPATKTGITPLLVATQFGYYDIVFLLVKYSANINTFSNVGVTPLSIAVCNGYSKIVAFLLQSGAKVNFQPLGCKITTLLLAAQNGYSDIVKLLIEYKATVNAEDYWGARPLHMAVQNGHNDVVNILVNAKADVNATDARGITPLHVACYNGHSVIVNRLIQFNANIYKTTKEQGFTPLYIARTNNHKTIVSLLKQTENNIIQDVLDRMGSLSISI